MYLNLSMNTNATHILEYLPNTFAFSLTPYRCSSVLFKAMMLFPYNLISLLSERAVNEVVTVAVNIDMMTNPTNTQKNAKTRAKNDLGARSPYPTVVIETKAHQKPSHDPLKNDAGNSSGFQ